MDKNTLYLLPDPLNIIKHQKKPVPTGFKISSNRKKY